MIRRFAIAAAVALCLCGTSATARAADIRLASPGAMKSSLDELIPQFQASSGDKVDVAYASALALADRVKNGTAVADVVIVGSDHADELLKLGKLVAGSKTVIAKVGVGVFVRRGDPKPDIGTVDAFDRALANAKAIAYSDPALGGTASNYVRDLLQSLDVTGSIQAKTKLAVKYRTLADFVANGGADFGLNQITEILADPRLELVGPLPAALQRYTYYAAALVPGSEHESAARVLISFLASPAAAAVMRSKGFEPLGE